MTTTTTSTNLSVWGCRVWDTINNVYAILTYVAATKGEAYAKCAELNPRCDIEDVYFIADY